MPSTLDKVRQRLLEEGKIKPDLNTSEGLEAFIRAEGEEPPPSIGERALSGVKRGLGVLNTPLSFVAGAVEGVTDEEKSVFGTAFGRAKESFTGEDPFFGFSDIARMSGVEPDTRTGKVGLAVSSFAADVLFDPLTYLTFGASAGLKAGGVTLTKNASKEVQSISRLFADDLIQKGASRATINKSERIAKTLASQSLGKRGRVAENAIKELRQTGVGEEVIQEAVSRVNRLGQESIDEGGIKMFGTSLVRGKTIAESPVGTAAKRIGQTPAVQGIKNTLGDLFVADFARNPKIVQALDKSGRQSRKAIAGILNTNKQLFGKLSDEQMQNFFRVVDAKKNEIAQARKTAESLSAEEIQELVTPEELVQVAGTDVVVRGDKPTRAARELAQSKLAKQAKESQRSINAEDLFPDDEELQDVARKLFDGETVQQTVTENGQQVTREIFREPIVQKFARTAGLPEDEAIKFYIPTKFREFVDIGEGRVPGRSLSSPKTGFLKRFTGVERDDKLTNPFELMTRGQIEVTTQRIKSDTVQSVLNSLGRSVDDLPEDWALANGYRKVSRNIIPDPRRVENRYRALQKVNVLNDEIKKSSKQLKNLKKTGRKVDSEIAQLAKQVDSLIEREAKEVSGFLSEGAKIARKTKPQAKIRGSGMLPRGLQQIGRRVDSFDSFEDLQKSDIGKDLSKRAEGGDLQDFGFDDERDFFEFVKNPFIAPKDAQVVEETVSGNLDKAVTLRKKAARLQERLGELKEINQPTLQEGVKNMRKLLDDVIEEKRGIIDSGVLRRPEKKEVWMKEDVADQLNTFVKGDGSSLDELARATGFDWATGLFKGYVTSLFPGFHIRNLTSNQFLSMIGIGVDTANPRLHNDAVNIIFGSNLDKQIVSKTGKRMTRREVRDLVMKETDVFNSGPFSDLEQFIGRDGVGLEGEMKDRFLKKFNPFSRNNIALEKGRALGTGIEAEGKLVAILSELSKGKTFRESVKTAEDVLFNYKKITPFERKVMRRLIPFYTFARKNAELQVKALATKPGAVAAQLKGLRSAGEAVGEPVTEDDIEGLPSWVLDSLGIKAGFKNQHGQGVFLTGFGLPIEEFLGRFSGDKGIATNVFKNVLTQSNPLLKFPAESATGVDFFRGRPITELNNADDLKHMMDMMPGPVATELKDLLNYREIENVPIFAGGEQVGTRTRAVANPFALHLLRNLPSARVQQTSGFLLDERNPTSIKLLRFFTGVRGWSIDQEEQQYFNELSRKRQLQDFLIQMGYVKRFSSVFQPDREK